MSDSKKDIEKLVKLTRPFIGKSDLIQGPGGNTSIKLDNGLMFIKASGFRFEEMSESSGVSCVDYKLVREYLNSVLPNEKSKDEVDMLEIVSNSIQTNLDGNAYPKPSMETGFHAVLDNFVIHTHSVWSNLINCASDREEKLLMLKQISGLEIADIPFVSPGFSLSYLVNEALKDAFESDKPRPVVFMLANHGIISHSDSENEAISQLNIIDDSIKSIIESENYPETEIIGREINWAPDSNFVFNTIKKLDVNVDFFNKVLFPDQTVFFKDNIGNETSINKKIVLGKNTISYKCNQREAKSIHETLTAYLYLISCFNNNKIEPKFIDKGEIDYINSMDMEKHRKSLF